MTKTHTNRFDKLSWMFDNTTEKHMKEMFLTELVNWLEEDEFTEFFKFHTRVWNIETPFDDSDDEDDSPNEFIVTDDEMVPVA